MKQKQHINKLRNMSIKIIRDFRNHTKMCEIFYPHCQIFDSIPCSQAATENQLYSSKSTDRKEMDLVSDSNLDIDIAELSRPK